VEDAFDEISPMVLLLARFREVNQLEFVDNPGTGIDLTSPGLSYTLGFALQFLFSSASMYNPWDLHF
jgi:hypothetical protein